jgi:hypothetical protein
LIASFHTSGYDDGAAAVAAPELPLRAVGRREREKGWGARDHGWRAERATVWEDRGVLAGVLLGVRLQRRRCLRGHARRRDAARRHQVQHPGTGCVARDVAFHDGWRPDQELVAAVCATRALTIITFLASFFLLDCKYMHAETFCFSRPPRVGHGNTFLLTGSRVKRRFPVIEINYDYNTRKHVISDVTCMWRLDDNSSN